jgi:hypothetical protein
MNLTHTIEWHGAPAQWPARHLPADSGWSEPGEGGSKDTTDTKEDIQWFMAV